MASRRNCNTKLIIFLVFLACIASIASQFHWLISVTDYSTDAFGYEDTNNDDDEEYDDDSVIMKDSESSPQQQLQRYKYKTNRIIKSPAHSKLPSCHPHYNSKSTPITRIYFYHIRKAGGTMIRSYLRKVASHYQLNLVMLEYKNAIHNEEVGSRNDTIYITNLRDPVERSISHFKYNGRWDCQQLVRNETFVPTQENAQVLQAWSGTQGFESSPCDIPFSFQQCAVNCYLQAFSGVGCTTDNWFTEYNSAHDRLVQYNMILVYEQFRNAQYVTAIEEFFGVKGFNEPLSMFCGDEARDANKHVPLRVGFETVLKLTKLNGMDNRLYKDIVSSCGWNDDSAVVKYSFPRADTDRFSAQSNRSVIGD